MGALDNLPPDQRAVLQLVLQRGRTYDEIGEMLSIDRAAVRKRALDGFDLLGPETSVPAPQRALLTDYLLSQLPPRVAAQVLERLRVAPADRAWVRVIAGELAPISAEPLPEIPTGPGRAAEAEERPRLHRERASAEAAGSGAAARAPIAFTRSDAGSGGEPRSSRRGGAMLLGGVAAIIVIAVVVVLLVTGGKSNTPASTGTSTAGAPTAPATTTATSATTSSTTLAQADLYVPGTTGTTDKKTTGVAEILKAGGETGVIVLAQGLPQNKTANIGAYAIWLDNPGGTSCLLGFPDTKVSTSGRLETEGTLSSCPNWTSYKDVLLTLETSKHPTAPSSHVVLEGTLTKAPAAS